MFVTYRKHFKPDPDPRESGQLTFSGITFWQEELPALRYANEHSLKVVKVETMGATLEELSRG